MILHVSQFKCRLRLKEYSWGDEYGNIEDETYKPLKRSSVWKPPLNKDPALETYIKAINNDIQKQIQRPKKFCHDNLTKEERQGLVSLRSRTDIVIKKANKGSATMVMSREQYVAEVMKHLQNQHHYEKLPRDLTELFSGEIKAFLTKDSKPSCFTSSLKFTNQGTREGR